MTRYNGTFHRYRESFDDSTLRRTLLALDGLGTGFFPMSMWLSKETKATFQRPGEYRRDLLPAGYYISPNIAYVPLACANGVALSFTESEMPASIPANLVMEFSDETLKSNRWSLGALLAMFRAVIPAFEPTLAWLYDDAHRSRQEYQDRMFAFDWRRVPTGLFWINYYGPEWARNVGLKRLDRLRSAVPVFEWLDTGGVLFAIQEEPYDESIASHRDNQKRLEELVGLRELQDSFPNPGL